MRPKLTELEMMKFWIDSEFQILHAMFAFVLTFHTNSWWQDALLWVYIAYCILYAVVRGALITRQDRNYLRIPQIDPDIVQRPRE